MSSNVTRLTNACAVLVCFALLTGCDLFADTQERVSQAQELIAAGDRQAAAIKLRNALQSEPENTKARVLLADVLLHLGDASGAEKELRRAMQGGVPAQDVAHLLARARLALGQAEILLTQIDSGELPLTEPAKSLYRGQALLDMREGKAAAEAFNAALAVDPDSAAARIGLAQASAALGDADAAFEELNRVLESDSTAAEAWLAKGALHAQRGEFEAAERDLQAAREHGQTLPVPRQIQLLAALAETALLRGDLAAAREIRGQLDKLARAAPISRVLAARIAMADQDYGTAVAELQKVVTDAPGFVLGRFLLGAALVAQGDLNQAEMHLAQTLQRAPENLEARKLLAEVRLRLARPDAAMQVLMPGQQAEVSDSQLDALLGLTHLQLGDTTAGIEYLERSVGDRPDNAALKLSLARAYLRAGQNDKAIELLKTVEHSPSDLSREGLLLTALGAAKGPGAARTEVERMLGQYPDSVPILNLAAEFYARQRELDRSRELIAKAAKLAPRDVRTLMSWARIDIAAGELESAQRRLEQAAAIEPSNETAQLGLAGLAVMRRDTAAAISRLNELRASNKSALRPRFMLAALHARDGRSKEADEVLAEVLQLAGSRAEVVNAVGLLHLETGRYPEAVSRFRSAVDLDGGNATYWFNLARAQLALDHAGAAREALGKSIALRPDWLAPVGALALLDVKEGKQEAAWARVQQLKKASPGEVAVLVLEGDVNLATGRHAAAASAYEAASNIRPDSTLAIKAYRARQLGNLPDPAAPLQKWLERRPDDLAARMLLAESLQVAGRNDRAISQYEMLVKQEPKHAAALNNLAWLYHVAGNPKAEATAQRAFELAPDVAAIADTYGWILVENDQAARGRDILKQAVTGPNVDPEIEYHYAVALARSGATQEARARLAALLERSSDFASHSDARRLHAELAAD